MARMLAGDNEGGGDAFNVPMPNGGCPLYRCLIDGEGNQYQVEMTSEEITACTSDPAYDATHDGDAQPCDDMIIQPDNDDLNQHDVPLANGACPDYRCDIDMRYGTYTRVAMTPEELTACKSDPAYDPLHNGDTQVCDYDSSTFDTPLPDGSCPPYRCVKLANGSWTTVDMMTDQLYACTHDPKYDPTHDNDPQPCGDVPPPPDDDNTAMWIALGVAATIVIVAGVVGGALWYKQSKKQ